MELDIRSLKESKVLSTSVEDDRRRREIDDAKKRAAAQNVDYPAFAALVSAAHLKPVDHKSLRLPKFEDKLSPAWSFDASGTGLQNKDTNFGSSTVVPEVNPTRLTSDSFRKYWSQISTSKEKAEFLAKIPACQLRNIFKVEVPPHILDGILQTLSQHLLDLDSVQVLSLLESLSDCPRFTISLKLGRPNLATLLFDRLLGLLQNQSELVYKANALKARYTT